jgi:putative hemolysin
MLTKYIGDALELGRSFIVSEYQKSHSALSLLWRGIGAFVVKNPKYKKLFGPVSISQDYHNISKSLIVQFLKAQKSDEEISKYIVARNPYKKRKFNKFETETIEKRINEIEDISILVSEIEKDGKGVPVLLRNYLKLNAKMIGFNVDPDFSDVLDCLIMVDLRTTEDKLLKRFMGRDGFAKFKSF